MDQCMWKVLQARRENDFRLLVEDHCEPPPGWKTCRDASKVTFHPFKTTWSYADCLRNGGWTNPEGLALPIAPPTPPPTPAPTPVPTPAPTTQAPAPTTEAPTTQAPTTQAPTTKAPTTEAP